MYKIEKKKRVKIKQKTYKSMDLAFGEWGIKALRPLEVTPKQIETLRRAIARKSSRKCRTWSRLVFNRPLTSKGGSRMGKGKGNIRTSVSQLNKGQIFFEIGNIPKEQELPILECINKKLWFPFQVVKKL